MGDAKVKRRLAAVATRTRQYGAKHLTMAVMNGVKRPDHIGNSTGQGDLKPSALLVDRQDFGECS
jgi:hypothetical protein